MDPQATIQRILQGIADNDLDEVIDACGDLNYWVGSDGFEPDYKTGFWTFVTKWLKERD